MDQQDKDGVPGADRSHSDSDPAAQQPSSMFLLQTILDSALDPGYRKAAQAGSKNESWWQTALLVVLVLLLGFGTGAAVRSLRLHADSADTARASLLEQLDEKQAHSAALQEEVTLLGEEAQSLTNAATPTLEVPASMSLASADRPVYGPGVIVELSDEDAVVRDSEVRAITNALWISGAEAISVDGIRLGPATTIRTAGSTILVDFKAVASPYTIEAVGNQQTMLEAVQRVVDDSASTAPIGRAGLSVSATPVDDLELDSATSSRFKYSEAVEEGGSR